MAASPTHYQVLGVARDAPPEAVHRAYLDAARRSHPDRNEGSSVSAEAMARINEAWRVLGHPGRRRQYDRELAAESTAVGSRVGAAPGSATVVPGSAEDDLVEVAPGAHPIFGFLPWLLVFGVLALIFVFTAYAASGSRQPDSGVGGVEGVSSSRLGECLVITSGRPTVAPIDCSVANDGQVVAEVGLDETCPVDTVTLQLPGEPDKLCLAG